MLDRDELAGVLSHELSHIRHRDTLIMTLAASIATAISYIANIAQWAAIFGGGRDEEKCKPHRSSGDHRGGSAGGDSDPAGFVKVPGIHG